MGNCKSLFRRSKEGDAHGTWATRRANPAAIVNHQKACKPSDFIRAFSIGQAFHAKKGMTKAPAKLNCSACGQFIVEGKGEQKFYACISCWKMGHALGICATCFQNERYCLSDSEGEAGSAAPEPRAHLAKRISNGSMTGSVGVETVVPPPLAMDPSPPSSESENELQLPGAVVEEKKTKTGRRRQSVSRAPRARRTSVSPVSPSSPVELETEDLSDSPSVSEPPGETSKGKVLSSQTSMKSTQLSTQGSMSSLGPRRLSSQNSLVPPSDGSPSPQKGLRRLSTQELHATSGPTKSQSAPNLKRRMSLPPVSPDGSPVPKQAAKKPTRRMSTQVSMKSEPPEGDASAGSNAANGSNGPTPEATPKRKPQGRRMSTQQSFKSTGTAGSSRRQSLAAAPEAAAEARRPSTSGGKRRNSGAKNTAVDDEEKRQTEEQRRQSNASQRSVEHLHRREQAPLPSGLWSATFIEGRKKHTRKEERHLIFTADGYISGAGQFNSSLEGRFKLPHVNWTETYSWGTIKVKAEVCKVPLRLEGTFETSDQGSGHVTFLPANSGV